MTEFDVLGAAAAGMDAQRAALEVAARNVAAAETGAAFARLVPRFRILSPSDPSDGLVADVVDQSGGDGAFTDPVVRFVGTGTEPTGDVDAITEMVAVLNAQRAYEANASVFDAGKRLAERTIDLGRP